MIANVKDMRVNLRGTCRDVAGLVELRRWQAPPVVALVVVAEACQRYWRPCLMVVVVVERKKCFRG